VILVHEDASSAGILARQLGSEGARCTHAEALTAAAEMMDNCPDEATSRTIVLVTGVVAEENRAAELLSRNGVATAILVSHAANDGAGDWPGAWPRIAVPTTRENIVGKVIEVLESQQENVASPHRRAPDGRENPADRTPSLSILVIEDDDNSALVLRSFVESLGHDCSVAVNGEEGVRAFQMQRPDIVLMDVAMPCMDGLEATQEIRAFERSMGIDQTPIIGLTANAILGDRERCLDAGMTDYMAKPIHFGALSDRLTHFATPQGAEYRAS
jgi:CheY-like chemotaxis protein